MAEPDWFSATGILRCRTDRCDGPQIFVELPEDFCDYPRSMLPKHLKANRPRYAPHITVVRKESVDLNPESPAWKRWEGQSVDFTYNPSIVFDDVYAWYRVESEMLHVVRGSLGLTPTNQFTRPPDGGSSFHITIANFKRK